MHSRRDRLMEVLLQQVSCPFLSTKDVFLATNNLHESNIIGEGTAGKVYRGIMPDNRHVAVKHILSDTNLETVVREVTSLSRVRHPNIVALLGCCMEEDAYFLIYELCPNGNLSEWLFGQDRDLSWIQRLRIAIGCARGLCFLHARHIIHRDVKPPNILLGPNFEAKVSDFGLCKVLDSGEPCVTTEVRGTLGYIDPELQSNCQVNPSCDVYSFGIVLLQLLSGEKVINLDRRKPMQLDKLAKKALAKGGGRRAAFVDPNLSGEYSTEAFDIAFRLAVSCTGPEKQRPAMDQVVVRLVNALDISTKAEASSPETSIEWSHASSVTCSNPNAFL
ncbi:hypothetical protein MLD38_034115 [Melastoma candidum]|uniref:Uncharacterized protein n=1 Tax=Melastoma candidum TaxID=119954 RepID=A0ACB9MD78_9MYRT|nr:hypothetical protein MLD38_034115 [Melastoma candidum]